MYAFTILHLKKRTPRQKLSSDQTGVKFYVVCLAFLGSNWKILHLAKFFTQPPAVMVFDKQEV